MIVFGSQGSDFLNGFDVILDLSRHYAELAAFLSLALDAVRQRAAKRSKSAERCRTKAVRDRFARSPSSLRFFLGCQDSRRLSSSKQPHRPGRQWSAPLSPSDRKRGGGLLRGASHNPEPSPPTSTVQPQGGLEGPRPNLGLISLASVLVLCLRSPCIRWPRTTLSQRLSTFGLMRETQSK